MNWFIADKKEVAENPKRNEEEVNFNLLLDISRIMNQLNIECKFILDCLIDVIARQYIKSVKIIF